MTRRRLLQHILVLFPACVPPPLLADKPAEMAPTGANLVVAARRQVGRTLTYDPAYVVLKYPMGDVPEESGVCADVIIRALRACGVGSPASRA